MAASLDITLTVATLESELGPVAVKWETLGRKLGLQEWRLEVIAADHPAGDGASMKRLSVVLREWLKNATDGSWSNIVSALKEMEENVLAKVIDGKYCKPAQGLSEVFQDMKAEIVTVDGVCLYEEQKDSKLRQELDSVNTDREQLNAVSTSTPISKLRQFMIPEARAKGKMLGRGTYGTVEEYDVNGVPCAGKRIYDVLVQSGARDTVHRYVEECKLLAKLRHPNVIQFLGVCFSPESALPVLIMEKLTIDLDSLLENTPNIPISLRMSFLTDVARGLAYLHGHGPPIIHRDLSARNVLLNSSLVAKISDLGNSCIVTLSPEEVTKLSFTPGALVYMPPEISEKSSCYGPSLDVFSFGHLGLFTAIQVFPKKLLSHTYPDSTNPRHRIGRSEVERRVRYFTQLHQQLGEDHSLVRVIAECLDNDPHQRPTAKQLVSRLEEMSVEVQSPQDHTAKLQLMGQLRQIEEGITRLTEEKETIQSQLRAEVEEIETLQCQLRAKGREVEGREREIDTLHSQLRVKQREVEEREREIDTLSAERRMLQSQLREREDSIEQLPKDAQLSKIHSLIDPANSGKLTIRECANIPTPTRDAQAVVIRGKAYVGGGRETKSCIPTCSDVFTYDVEGDSWSTIESSTSYAALASYNENLVLAGGWVLGHVDGVITRQRTNQLWVLGDDDHWQQPIPPMTTPRVHASAVGYGQHLVVAGGVRVDVLNTVEVYSGQQWMTADPMPRGYCVMKSTVLNGTWYLTGGYKYASMDGEGTNSVLSVSLQLLTERAASPQRDGPSPWNKLKNIPSTLMAIASTGGGLVAFGDFAFSSILKGRSYAYIYFPPTKSWTKIGGLPHYLHSTCAITLPSGEVMLCGGTGSDDEITIKSVYAVKNWD